MMMRALLLGEPLLLMLLLLAGRCSVCTRPCAAPGARRDSLLSARGWLLMLFLHDDATGTGGARRAACVGWTATRPGLPPHGVLTARQQMLPTDQVQ